MSVSVRSSWPTSSILATAEIHEQHAALGALEHDVLGLQVAVDDAAGVGLLQRGRRLDQDADRFVGAQRAGLLSRALRVTPWTSGMVK